MAGIIKESGICPVLTFYLFNLYRVGEIVQLEFLITWKGLYFFLLYQG